MEAMTINQTLKHNAHTCWEYIVILPQAPKHECYVQQGSSMLWATHYGMSVVPICHVSSVDRHFLWLQFTDPLTESARVPVHDLVHFLLFAWLGAGGL